jgi:hypothetical protein
VFVWFGLLLIEEEWEALSASFEELGFFYMSAFSYIGLRESFKH